MTAIEVITSVLVEDLQVSPSQAADPAMRLIEDLRLDPLDRLELILALEQEHGLEQITNDQFRSAKTVGDLRRLVARYVQ